MSLVWSDLEIVVLETDIRPPNKRFLILSAEVDSAEGHRNEVLEGGDSDRILVIAVDDDRRVRSFDRSIDILFVIFREPDTGEPVKERYPIEEMLVDDESDVQGFVLDLVARELHIGVASWEQCRIHVESWQNEILAEILETFDLVDHENGTIACEEIARVRRIDRKGDTHGLKYSETFFRR